MEPDETLPVPETPAPQPEDPRTIITRILDKAHNLLLGEPARLIGYGAAIVIFLAAQFLASRGYVKFEGLTFEDSVGLAIATIALVVTVIESIRRFVYSPLTYIEDLADEWAAGHDAAHNEHDLVDALMDLQQRIRATQVPVAPAPVANPDRQN